MRARVALCIGVVAVGILGTWVVTERVQADPAAPTLSDPISAADQPVSCPGPQVGVGPCEAPCTPCMDDCGGAIPPTLREPTDPEPPGRGRGPTTGGPGAPPPPNPPVTTPTTPGAPVTTPPSVSVPQKATQITPLLSSAVGSIDVATGEFRWMLALPMSERGSGPGIAFRFPLIYRSRVTVDGVTGNWDVGFNQRLVVLPNGDVQCYTGTGRSSDVFLASGSGYMSPIGWSGALSQINGLGGAFPSFRLSEIDGRSREYDALGYLTRLSDRHGNAVVLVRSTTTPSQVVQATDPSGRIFQFGYVGGRLSTVTDPVGGVQTLGYDSATGRLVSVTTPIVSFVDSAGLPQTRGIQTSFEYDTAGHLTRVRDDAGHIQVENDYDGFGRVTEQTNALGGTCQLSYLSGATEVVRPDGYLDVYSLDATGFVTRFERFTASGMGLPALRTGESNSYVTTYTKSAACNCGAIASIVAPNGSTWTYARNASGQILSLTIQPPSGSTEPTRTWSWTYAFPFAPGYGNVLTYTDPGGSAWSYSYDPASGNMLQRLSPTVSLGQPAPQAALSIFTYDVKGRLQTATDPQGHQTQYTYSGATSLVQSMTRDPGGLNIVTSWQRDGYGRPISETDPGGAVTTYIYDALGRLIERVEPSGGTRELHTFDARGQLVAVKVENRDEAGALRSGNPHWETTFVRDPSGGILAQSSEVGPGIFATTAWTRDTSGRATLETSPAGRRVANTYDEQELVHQAISDPGGALQAVTTSTYDGSGFLAREVGATGNTQTYVRDSLYRVVLTTRPDGTTVQTTYGVAASPTAQVIRNAAGVAVLDVEFLLDERGRKYSSVEHLLTPGGARTGTTRLGTTDLRVDGEAARITDTLGRFTDLIYDQIGRLTQAVSTSGDAAVCSFDSRGNVTQVVEYRSLSGGATLVSKRVMTYDALSRCTGITWTDSSGVPTLRQLNAVYDGLGQVVERSDALGNRTRYARDGHGRVLEERMDLRAGGTGSGALQGEVILTHLYDLDGRRIENRNDAGHAWTFAYDARGRLSTVTLPGGAQWSYGWTAANGLSGWTDPNGTVVTQALDSVGRVTSRTISRATGVLGPTQEVFAWDALGRMTYMQDDDSRVARSFDSLGRMTDERAGGTTLPPSPTLGLVHDLAGFVTQITYPSARIVGQTCDAFGRLASVTSAGLPTMTFGWQGRLPVQQSIGPAISETRVFDPALRLVQDTVTTLGSLVRDEVLLWDAADRLSGTYRIDQGGRGDLLSYDSIARLTGARLGVANVPAELASPSSQPWVTRVDFTLDDQLNRTHELRQAFGLPPVSVPSLHDARNRLVQKGGGPIRTYSARGELQSDGVQAYAYDYRGRLVEVKTVGGALVAQYGWDPSDRRDTRARAGTAPQRFYHLGARLLAIHNGTTGALLAEFIHGSHGAAPDVAVALDVTDLDQDGDFAEMLSIAFAKDHTGSVREVLAVAGGVLEQFQYDESGNITCLGPSGVVRSTPLTPTPHRFHGMSYDDETQFHVAGPRAYSAAIGTWVQADPLGDWGDTGGLGNAYQAFRHAATSFIDPDGRATVALRGWGGVSDGAGASSSGSSAGSGSSSGSSASGSSASSSGASASGSSATGSSASGSSASGSASSSGSAASSSGSSGSSASSGGAAVGSGGTAGSVGPQAGVHGGAQNVVKDPNTFLDSWNNWQQYVGKLKELRKKDPCERIILIGHSMGGVGVLMLADALNKEGICVDLLVTIDAVQSWVVDNDHEHSGTVPKNVGSAVNVYHESGSYPAWGLGTAHGDIQGADNHYSNEGHKEIDDAASTWDIIKKALDGMRAKPPCCCPPPPEGGK